jgi:beta-glucosidase
VGTATAAYQVEGAVREDGREVDLGSFAHTPGKTANGETGDVACDHYHRWQEDIGLVRRSRSSGLPVLVAWPRVVPLGDGTDE